MRVRALFAQRIIGGLSPALSWAISETANTGLHELLCAGIQRWEADGFPRFYNHEANSAVEVIKYCNELRSSRDAWSWLRFISENLEMDRAILERRVSAQRAGRPDIRVIAGREYLYTIECKRLSASSKHVAGYVDEGVMRFTSGKYCAQDKTAGMIGFDVDDTPSSVVPPINTRIRRKLDASHQLQDLATSSVITRCESNHVRQYCPEIELTHYFVDMSL